MTKTMFGLSVPPLKLHVTLQRAGESAKDGVREKQAQACNGGAQRVQYPAVQKFMASPDTFTARLLLSDPLFSHFGH